MVLVEGSTYALDPEPAFIPATSNDWSLLRRASHILRFEELFDLAARGELDRMFLSGGQIDPYGNTNVTAIGGLPSPKVKLGGGGGGCNMSATWRADAVDERHARAGRSSVVRFITDLAPHAARTRAELGSRRRTEGARPRDRRLRLQAAGALRGASRRHLDAIVPHGLRARTWRATCGVAPPRPEELAVCARSPARRARSSSRARAEAALRVVRATHGVPC